MNCLSICYFKVDYGLYPIFSFDDDIIRFVLICYYLESKKAFLSKLSVLSILTVFSQFYMCIVLECFCLFSIDNIDLCFMLSVKH